MEFRAPTPIVRQRILAWTVSWHVLCLSAIIAWGHGVLSLSWNGLPTSQVFIVAAMAGSIALSLIGRRVRSLFDRPVILGVTTALLFVGTVLIYLPRLGIGPSDPAMILGLVACGMGTALIFVLWCECLARYSTVRVVFTLCINLVISVAIIWFGWHLDGIGFFVEQLCLVALCYAGIRRSWEVGRGDGFGACPGVRIPAGKGCPDAEATSGNAAAESANATDPGTTGESAAVESAMGSGAVGESAAGKGVGISRARRIFESVRILTALFVIVTCLVIVRSLAHGSIMEFVSLYSVIAPLALLIAVCVVSPVTSGHLFRIFVVVAVMAVLCLGMPFSASGELTVALCDLAYTGLFILLAAMGSDYTAHSSSSVCQVAGNGCTAFAAASLLGGIASERLSEVFPYGTGFPIIAVACLAIVLVGIATLNGSPALATNIALDAPAKDDREIGLREIEPETGEAAFLPESRADATLPDITADDLREFGSAHGLPKRRVEVLALLLQGMSTAQIARELVVAQGTVKAHIHGIYATLGVHSRDELFALAKRELSAQGAARKGAQKQQEQNGSEA